MKKKIIYFHRYPIDYESEQFPAAIPILENLKKNNDVFYISMGLNGKQEIKNKIKGIKFIELPIKIDRFNTLDKWIKTLKYYLFLPETISKLKKLNPDFIICKETLPFVPSAIVRLNKPTLIDISDWWWSIMLGKNKLGRKIAQFLEKKEVEDWNKFKVICITHTKSEAKLMIDKGMNPKKIRTINAPQHKEVYFPIKNISIRNKIGIKKGSWVVAMHGIIHPSKGYFQILDWWKKIISEHKNWVLLIIGGSGEEEACREKIEKMNLKNNVIMTGWLPTQKDVNIYLNSSDCLMVTRRNTPENQGIIPSSLYHNMAVGKPTIATGLPGMSEIIEHGKNGYVFKPDSFVSFKSVLEEVYNNPAKAKKAAKKGIETASKSFDLDLCSENYSKLIREFS